MSWLDISSLCTYSLTRNLQLHHFMISKAKIKPFCTFILWKAKLEYYSSRVGRAFSCFTIENGLLLQAQKGSGHHLFDRSELGQFNNCQGFPLLWLLELIITIVITYFFLSVRPIFFFFRNLKCKTHTLNLPSMFPFKLFSRELEFKSSPQALTSPWTFAWGNGYYSALPFSSRSPISLLICLKSSIISKASCRLCRPFLPHSS